MKIETRIYDTVNKKMVYLPPLRVIYGPQGNPVGVCAINVSQIGPTAVSETVAPIMLKSHFGDMNQKPLWEGDIIECDIINEFGSLMPARALVTNREGLFMIEVEHGKVARGATFNVTNMRLIGNVIENVDLRPNLYEKKENATAETK